VKTSLCFALSLLLAQSAAAQGDYFDRKPEKTEVKYRVANPRSTNNRIVLASLAGTSLVSFAAGILFHSSRNSSADKVEADNFTGETWTSGKRAAYDKSRRHGRYAVASYAVGSALVIATITYYLFSDPGERIVTEGEAGPSPFVIPTSSSLAGGVQWTF
jgi:hypothetical protein